MSALHNQDGISETSPTYCLCAEVIYAYNRVCMVHMQCKKKCRMLKFNIYGKITSNYFKTHQCVTRNVGKNQYGKCLHINSTTGSILYGYVAYLEISGDFKL